MIVHILRLPRGERFKLRRGKPHGCRPLLHQIPLPTSTRILSVELPSLNSSPIGKLNMTRGTHVC